MFRGILRQPSRKRSGSFCADASSSSHTSSSHKVKDDATHSTSDTFSLTSVEEHSESHHEEDDSGSTVGGESGGFGSGGSCDDHTISAETFGGETIMFDIEQKNRQNQKPGQKKGKGDSKLASKERAWVFRSKCLAALVLFFAATAMAYETYWLITEGEEKDFETQFRNYASEIIGVSQENAANTFRTIEGLGVTITSYAQDSNKKWPYVTLPHFDARAQAVEARSGVRLLCFSPLVTNRTKDAWERYTARNARDTFQQSVDYQGMDVDVDSLQLWPHIYQGDLKTFQFAPEEGPGPYLPMWQLATWKPYLSGMINYNLLDGDRVAKAFATSSITKRPTLNFFVITGTADSVLIQPIFDKVISSGQEEKKVVGALWVLIDWINYFKKILPDNAGAVYAVVRSSDGDFVTYKIDGMDASFLGEGDFHDTNYDHLEVTARFAADLDIDDSVELPDHLRVPTLTLHLYPSDELREKFITNDATIYTGGVLMIFAFTTLVFVIFDYTVRRHQEKVMYRVMQQDKIVSNIFPEQLKDRLYGVDEDDHGSTMSKKTARNAGINALLDPNDFENMDSFCSAPIADLYPSTTVLFSDISGFTAWSSQREPPQVFRLLETIYGAFDKLASNYGVFKVETVGDCYVAVCGLPDPNKDHASIMAKFARDCMEKMNELTKKLEISLGPDTADLQIRIGLHSGQVTGGVLRGERSRFQLFGDTVNTAARMESTGIANKIHLSRDTALLLQGGEKSKWIKPREEKIFVKGKGNMQTYWLETKEETKKRVRESRNRAKAMFEKEMRSDSDVSDGSWGECEDEATGNHDSAETMGKMERLVEWNVEILGALLRQILACRDPTLQADRDSNKLAEIEARIGRETTVLEEFKEIISLPKIGPEELSKRRDPNEIVLSENVLSQMRDFISHVAGMYRSNDFHNFEHASHVTASVKKLLTRIIDTDAESSSAGGQEGGYVDLVDLAGHSYGITSDPLTQFSVVFSAVIHDMDHPGVTNAVLVKEKSPIAALYKEKSVAEQNSVDLAWDLLMKDEYKDFRECIYSNEDELRRFRQLIVNVVMATDICDKELNALRKARWATAFSETNVDPCEDLSTNRKATIVIEHLIQASDVSHTMQHWHIYLKWNEMFFMESYKAYKDGRSDVDPTEGWYKGEIGFFDFYIIPLAKKLGNCGVFGVSSHEYLNYAQNNRDEWEREGENIVKRYLEKWEKMNSNAAVNKEDS